MNEKLTIQDQIAEYRQLIEQRRDLNKELNRVKFRIFDHVFENGDYEDEDGFARKRTKPQQYRVVNTKVLADIAYSWAGSEDPILKSCGETVVANLLVKDEQDFVAIK